MRKKSHISLSKYLLLDMELRIAGLKQRRKSFCIGSILPDILPSFIYRKHSIDATYELLQKKLLRLSKDIESHAENSIRFWLRLGTVMHYLADYCTYPHNRCYDGTLAEHCHYEKELKKALLCYIKGEIPEHFHAGEINPSSYEINELIRSLHREYLNSSMKLESDCRYIVSMCRSVLTALLGGKYDILTLSPEVSQH